MAQNYLQQLFGFDSRVAVVIGGTGVLGGTLCEGLAQAGATVVVAGRNAERGAGRVAAIEKLGGQATFVSVDASDRGSVQSLLDATLQSALLGVSGLRDLATSVDIVVIAIPANVLRKIDADVYLPAVIPANTYRGQTKDVPTVAVQNVLVTHEGVPDDTVYDVTRTLWTSTSDLVAAPRRLQ